MGSGLPGESEWCDVGPSLCCGPPRILAAAGKWRRRRVRSRASIAIGPDRSTIELITQPFIDADKPSVHHVVDRIENPCS